MPIITGKYGYVNGIPCVQSWGYNRASTVGRYAASCTDFGTGAHNGNINESGIITGIGGNPPVSPGQTLTFKGVADNTPGAAEVYDGTVLITSLDIEVPKEAGTPITWSAAFGVQGQLVPGSTGAADATYAEHIGASITSDPQISEDGAAWISLTGARRWTMNFNTPEKTRVSNGETLRAAGNLEAGISIDMYGSTLRNINFDINRLKFVRLFVSAAEVWSFQWIKFSEATGYNVNRATQDWIGFTINGIWSAVKGTTLGFIVRPDETDLFP